MNEFSRCQSEMLNELNILSKMNFNNRIKFMQILQFDYHKLKFSFEDVSR